MILIIGGAYQGKAAFAESLFPKIRWADGESCVCWKKGRMWMILRRS